MSVKQKSDRKKALEELLAQVEAALDTAHHHAKAFPSESAGGKCTWHDSHKASQGSLDAAKSLHEAVLPGWDVACLDQASNLAGSPWGCEVGFYDGPNPSKNKKAYSGHNFDRNPARAWLIAILKALIAEATP